LNGRWKNRWERHGSFLESTFVRIGSVAFCIVSDG
jgi:hypothetical protein